MLRKSVILAFLYMFAVSLLMIETTEAATIETLTFNQLVERSALVVEGTVIDLQVMEQGVPIRDRKVKASLAPTQRSARGPRKPGDPTVVGEGGRMLFTDVTLAIDRTFMIDNSSAEPAGTITFRIAGGVKDGLSVSVHGLPTFEMGDRTIVFLVPEFQSTATPLVGLHQGYFRVLNHPQTGEELLLDFQGDLALGIEDGHLAVRRPKPEELSPGFEQKVHRTMPQLIGAPVSEDGSTIALSMSPKVVRYWLSDEAPLTIDAFFQQIASRIQEGR